MILSVNRTKPSTEREITTLVTKSDAMFRVSQVWMITTTHLRDAPKKTSSIATNSSIPATLRAARSWRRRVMIAETARARFGTAVRGHLGVLWAAEAAAGVALRDRPDGRAGAASGQGCGAGRGWVSNAEDSVGALVSPWITGYYQGSF